ncbi:fibrous sheath CABYR-binding protein-like isoform X2 [Sardina pilchardus]|uniref:fibrous sheath CABYR-binding protein-like isoform X2 n=1 Tax=Sardina pilchardus TaxID=27697 RepID=UPI002E0E0F60
MSLALMLRLPWLCLFFLTDVGLCSPLLQGSEEPLRFGFSDSRRSPPSSAPVSSVSHSFTNGEDVTSPRKPVPLNLNSHQEKLVPMWVMPSAPVTQKPKVPQAPAQEVPAWVQTPPAWAQTAPAWFKIPPAPVNQEPKTPEAPAQEPQTSAQTRPAWIMPSAPVTQKPKVPQAPAQELPAWVQTPPAWMLPAPVNQEPKTPEAPAQELPALAQTWPAWFMPSAPVTKKPKVPQAPAQEVPAWVQTPPVWVKMPPAPVTQAPAQEPPAWNNMPQSPASQAPAQTPPPPMTPLEPVGGDFGSSFMEGVSGEAASNGGGTEGPSSERERYLVITEPLGFQTRYVVKSFNRYVRGQKIYSQTTYIPLDYPPVSEPAPVPTLPLPEAQLDQTVKAS